MTRFLFLLHRYVGLLLCVLVAAWCLSGFVMMYVRFPSFYGDARLATLSPLNLRQCCDFAAVRDTVGEQPIDAFRIEMLAERPVLRLDTATGQTLNVDLADGSPIDSISRAQAEQVAAAHARAAGAGPTPRLLDTPDHDQWTVGLSRRDRPLYRFALDDAEGTQVYVSATSGMVVQRTTARQRFWNYLGAVPHWIYPTVLRERVATWSRVVTWSAIAGLLLALSGLYLGWIHWRPGTGTRASPFRGVSRWHHYSGLLAGLLVIAWIGSGLVSMNPWGLLEPGSSAAERRQLAGLPINATQAIAAVESLLRAPPEGDVRVVSSAPFDGRLFLLARAPSRTQRIDAETLQPATLGSAALETMAARLQPGQPVREAALTDRDDAYYYAHHALPQFPVFRVVLGDPGATRYYIDPRDGSLLRKVDRNGQWWRWLFSAPHQWDLPLLRRRPVWDVVVVLLLAGTATSAVTGVWLGVRHARRLAMIGR